MKPEYVQSFMIKYGECFDVMRAQEIQNKIAAIDDDKAAPLMSLELQKPTFILVIAILLGWERFFLDDIGMGILKVITCYGFGIWWLIDIFSAKKRTYDYNYKRFNEVFLFCH